MSAAQEAMIASQITGLSQVKELQQTVAAANEALFSNMTDQLVEFAVTGAFTVKQMADNIVRDLLRIALQAYVLKPLLDFGNAGLGSLFKPDAPPIDTGWLTTTTVPGFAQGGSFTVPGAGTGDRPTLLTGLAPGENVRITPAGRTGGMDDGPQVSVNVTVNSSKQFETKTSERMTGGVKIIDVVLNEVRKDLGRGGFDKPLEARFGLRTRVANR